MVVNVGNKNFKTKKNKKQKHVAKIKGTPKHCSQL